MPFSTKDHIEDRLSKVMALYLQGKTQVEIALVVNVSQGQVSQDLARIRERWLAQQIDNYDEMVREELARIDLVEREFWQAWLESKEEQVEERTRKSGRIRAQSGEQGQGNRNLNLPDRVETARVVKKKEGNSEFLKGVLACIEKRCKLLGLEKPEKTEETLTVLINA